MSNVRRVIRVTYTVDLPEWWGAEFAYDDGGEHAVIELASPRRHRCIPRWRIMVC